MFTIRRVSELLVVGAVLLMAMGLVRWREQSQGVNSYPALELESSAKSFGGAFSGQEPVVSFSLTNRSRATVRVLGAALGCGFADGCCVNSQVLQQRHVVIAPGETVALDFTCFKAKPGHYHVEFPIYTEAPGQGIIMLTIDGQFSETASTGTALQSQAPPGPQK